MIPADANISLANFSAFEIDDEVLANLREYALANSLFWVSNAHIPLARYVADKTVRRSQKATLVNNQPAVTRWM